MVYWKKRIRILSRRGLWYSLALCLTILLLGGVGFLLLEPQTPTLHEAMWLAFTTAATVGYGDLVPSTLASRAFAVLVVILGLAVLSLVTASLAAIFVETEERQVERDLMQEIGALRAEVRALRSEVTAALAAPGKAPDHDPMP
jgi:voltage-gated potassium channel